jgi:hypothetical protein
LYICKQKQKKFFERRNGGLPVNKITSEYISWESQRDVSKSFGGGEILSVRKPQDRSIVALP